jgi:hypothetical protein
MVDDRGESDLAFFSRTGATIRSRLPFDAELPVEVWQPAAAAGLAIRSRSLGALRNRQRGRIGISANDPVELEG